MVPMVFFGLFDRRDPKLKIISRHLGGMICGLEFFGADHALFATDTPLGPIAPTAEAVKRLDLPADQMRKLFVGNAERLLNRRFN